MIPECYFKNHEKCDNSKRGYVFLAQFLTKMKLYIWTTECLKFRFGFSLELHSRLWLKKKTKIIETEVQSLLPIIHNRTRFDQKDRAIFNFSVLKTLKSWKIVVLAHLSLIYSIQIERKFRIANKND